MATYACDTGFILDLSLGGSEMRTCVDDMDNDAEGVFDNQAPICVRKSLSVWFPYNNIDLYNAVFNSFPPSEFNHMQVSFANLFSLTPMVW